MSCENAKVGDKVTVHSGGMMNYRSDQEITGETPKQTEAVNFYGRKMPHGLARVEAHKSAQGERR